MPLPGFPTSVPPGDHKDFLLIWDVKDLGTGLDARVTMQAATGYGGMYWALICDGLTVRVIFLPEGKKRVYTVPYLPWSTTHAVSAAPLGDWDFIPPGVEPACQQEYFTTDKGRSIQIDWDAVIQTNIYRDTQLAAGTFTGLRRYLTGRPVENQPTQLRLDLVITSVGAVHTVTLYNYGTKIAEGSRNGDGAISLTQQNSSGLSWDTVLTYTGDIALGTAFIIASWAKQYRIYIDSVLITTLSDTGLSNRLTYRSPAQTAGVHNVQVKAVSDTGVDGTIAVNVPVTIPGRPEKPGFPVYSSGGAGYGTNVLSSPETFNAANWDHFAGVTVGTEAGVNPAGGTTLYAVSEVDGSSAVHEIYQGAAGFGPPITLTDGVKYTVYMIAKKGATRDWCVLSLTDNLSQFHRVLFNVTTGAYGLTLGSPTLLPAVNFGDGWWLFGFTFTQSTSTIGTIRFDLSDANLYTGNAPHFYNGVAGAKMYVYRASVEVGVVANTPTIISFSPSSTGPSTYRGYDSVLDGPPDLGVVATTSPAGATTRYMLLPAIAVGAGKRRVMVAAVNGGIEDGTYPWCMIEYDVNGNVIRPRPRVPGFTFNQITGGLTLKVDYVYDSNEELGVGAVAQLFMALDGAAQNYSKPAVAAAIGAVDGQGIRRGTLSGVVVAGGMYNWVVRIATAPGAFADEYGDAGNQLSGWVINGASLSNTDFGNLYWNLTNAAGIRTVDLYKDVAKTQKVATGSISGDGIISLAAVGGSGLTASVAVIYSGDDTDALNVVTTYTQSLNTIPLGPKWLNNTVLAAPANITTTVVA